MKSFFIGSENGNINAQVFLYLKNFSEVLRADILKDIMKDFQDTQDFAGWRNKEELRSFLEWSIFGRETAETFNFEYNPVQENQIKDQIILALNSCENFFKANIRIFIFPVLDSFVSDFMGGCCGFYNGQKAITLEVNLKNNWQKSFENTIYHELAHVVSPYYNDGEFTLSEGFILDGLAEHFKNAISGKNSSLFGNSLDKSAALEILKRLALDQKLEDKDLSFWQEVFFGGGKYPPWAGYSIGYYLVEAYLNDLKSKGKQINWQILLKLPPKPIFLRAIELLNLKL